LQNFDEKVVTNKIEESIVPQEKKDLIANKDEVFKQFGPMLGQKKDKQKSQKPATGTKAGGQKVVGKPE